MWNLVALSTYCDVYQETSLICQVVSHEMCEQKYSLITEEILREYKLNFVQIEKVIENFCYQHYKRIISIELNLAVSNW